MANSKKILIIVALVLAVCVVYLFFFFQPKKVEISDLESALDKKKVDMTEKQRIAKDVEKFNVQVKALDEQLKESLAQLPNDKEIPQILRLFAKLASISGIEMTNFTVLPEIKKALYAEVPIDLQLTGGFHNIAIFFDKISKQDRIINISNVKIANPTIINGETQVVTTCTATAFRFISPAEAAAAAPPPPPRKPKEKAEPEDLGGKGGKAAKGEKGVDMEELMGKGKK
jgi:type IV pilus assembly protein PilO